MNFRLLALSLGAFAIGVTEFTPMGLLPLIAQEMHVSIPTAGLLISAYAGGVMIGAPITTLFLSAYRRKSALLALMALFTMGNLLSVFAPTYELLVASRVLTSIAHGAFFGIGSLVAASLVPHNRRAAAIASMFMGLTIANIAGVPAATWLGHEAGWRAAFLATGAIGLLTLIALYVALPWDSAQKRPDVSAELRVLVRPSVIAGLLTTVLSAGSMFTLYTYIAAVLEAVLHASPTLITMMLIVIGVGFTIGNSISGRLSDRSHNATLAGCLILLSCVSFIFPLVSTTAPGAAVALLIWGGASFGVVAPLQIRVMTLAAEAPALASAVNVGAFNMGNALGAAGGGLVLSMGLGYQAIAPAGGLFALLALALAFAPVRQTQERTAAVQG
ncbi:MFS transporter [Pseudomonas syringae]|uniref:MFS transporter n=1 Tax=Pseudomonas syringae TaxID=317 RepID=UPI00215B1ACD|nr:MFS transporter [Pseudomonas syringae]MCR8717703.1 MFS transporter [Pseudomonas syringae]